MVKTKNVYTHVYICTKRKTQKIEYTQKKIAYLTGCQSFQSTPLPFPYVIHILSSARDIVFHEHINNVLLTFCVMTGRMQVQNLF